MTAGPVAGAVCTARAWSVSPRCPCLACLEKRRTRRQQRDAGVGVNLHEQAWVVLADLVDNRGWSPRSVASATGLSHETISMALSVRDRTGHLRRFGPRISSAIIRHGYPEVGFIGATGSMRRLRAMARDGWAYTALARGAGLPVTTAANLIAGRGDRADVNVAVVIDGLWLAHQGRVGTSWQAMGKAKAAGWAPSYAWVGVDIDDPSVTLPSYPHADRRVHPKRARKAPLRRSGEVTDVP